MSCGVFSQCVRGKTVSVAKPGFSVLHSHMVRISRIDFLLATLRFVKGTNPVALRVAPVLGELAFRQGSEKAIF